MMTASPSTDSLYGCSEASVMSDMSFAVGPSPSGDMMKASLGGELVRWKGLKGPPDYQRCVPGWQLRGVSHWHSSFQFRSARYPSSQRQERPTYSPKISISTVQIESNHQSFCIYEHRKEWCLARQEISESCGIGQLHGSSWWFMRLVRLLSYDSINAYHPTFDQLDTVISRSKTSSQLKDLKLGCHLKLGYRQQTQAFQNWDTHFPFSIFGHGRNSFMQISVQLMDQFVGDPLGWWMNSTMCVGGTFSVRKWLEMVCRLAVSYLTKLMIYLKFKIIKEKQSSDQSMIRYDIQADLISTKSVFPMA